MITVTEAAQQALRALKPDDRDKVTLRFFINMEGGGSATYEYDLVLDEPREEDEVFAFGDVQVVVDRSSYFFIDEPLRIDYDAREQVFRLRADTHVIPDTFRLGCKMQP